MKSVITTILFALLIGVTAAFMKPAAPYQVDTNPALFARGGASTFDAGLDNPEIAEDTNISPSRKCGFCMGVRSISCVCVCHFLSLDICSIADHSSLSFLDCVVSRADQLSRVRLVSRTV